MQRLHAKYNGCSNCDPNHLLDYVYDVNLQGECGLFPGDGHVVPDEVIQTQAFG